jgi:hypothetical protein
VIRLGHPCLFRLPEGIQGLSSAEENNFSYQTTSVNDRKNVKVKMLDIKDMRT